MKVGILGTGMMGKIYARILSNYYNIDEIKMYDRDIDKLNEICSELKLTAIEDIEYIINDKEIKVVAICLPTKGHKELIVRCLKEGKDVISEIPLYFSLEEWEYILKAEKESIGKLYIASTLKFHSYFRIISKMIADGNLGELKSLFLNRRCPPYGNEIKKVPKEYASITNLIYYDLDCLSKLFGKPLTVRCNGIKGKWGTVEQLFAMIEYKSMNSLIEFSAIMPEAIDFMTSLRIVGDKGSLDMNLTYENNRPRCELYIYLNGEDRRIVEIEDTNPYEEEIKYILDCIEGKRKNDLLKLEDMLKVVNMYSLTKESFYMEGKKFSF